MARWSCVHRAIVMAPDAVIEQVTEWQNRPLDAVYPIVYLDCIVLKVRQDSRVINKSVFLALGINIEGQKELLGMWLAENEGAKFWLNVLTELKNRGLNDILIACVDGLKGFPDAINTVYPEARIQLCIVHIARNSLRFGQRPGFAVSTGHHLLRQQVSPAHICILFYNGACKSK